MVKANRRKHPRVPAKGFSGHLQQGDSVELGLPIHNISLGGIYVREASPLPAGSPVLLEITRPGLAVALKVPGRVVKAVTAEQSKVSGLPKGMSIAFDAMPSPLRDQLAQIIEDLKALNPPPLPDDEHELAPDGLDFHVTEATPLPPKGKGIPPPVVPAVAVPEGARLMVQVRGLLMELGEVQAKLENQDRELLDAQQAREAAERTLLEQRQRADSLQQRLDKVHEDIGQRDYELARRTAELSHRDQALAQREKKLAHLTQELESKNRQISDLDRNFTERDNMLGSTKRELASAYQSIDQYRRETDELKAMLLRKEQWVAELEAMVRDLQKA